MPTQKKILSIILQALQNTNDELSEENKFKVNLQTPLFGPNAMLDSLALVSVIVDVEGDVANELGRSISLTDDRALSQDISPFDSVETLLNYIMGLINEN